MTSAILRSLEPLRNLWESSAPQNPFAITVSQRATVRLPAPVFLFWSPRHSRPPKINCLGLWRSKTICFGGGWRPEGRQVINSTGELWHSRMPTNEFGCHCLAGGILHISSSSDVRTVYRHIQHRAAPRPPGCKG
jgi:hypothetical protein